MNNAENSSDFAFLVISGPPNWEADDGHATCLGEESESPRLDRKRGPGEFCELVLGLLSHPGIK